MNIFQGHILHLLPNVAEVVIIPGQFSGLQELNFCGTTRIPSIELLGFLETLRLNPSIKMIRLTSVSFIGQLPAQFEPIDLAELQGLAFTELRPQDANAVARSVTIPDTAWFSVILHGRFRQVRHALDASQPTGLLVQRMAATNLGAGNWFLDLKYDGLALNLGQLALSLVIASPNDRARAVKAVNTLLSNQPNVLVDLLVEGPDHNLAIQEFIQGPFTVINIELDREALFKLVRSTLFFWNTLSVKANGHPNSSTEQAQFKRRFKTFLRVNCQAAVASEDLRCSRRNGHSFITWRSPSQNIMVPNGH